MIDYRCLNVFKFFFDFLACPISDGWNDHLCAVAALLYRNLNCAHTSGPHLLFSTFFSNTQYFTNRLLYCLNHNTVVCNFYRISFMPSWRLRFGSSPMRMVLGCSWKLISLAVEGKDGIAKACNALAMDMGICTPYLSFTYLWRFTTKKLKLPGLSGGSFLESKVLHFVGSSNWGLSNNTWSPCQKVCCSCTLRSVLDIICMSHSCRRPSNLVLIVRLHSLEFSRCSCLNLFAVGIAELGEVGSL